MPRPSVDIPGHAEIPDLRSDNHRENSVLEMLNRLSRLHLSIEGPFTTPPEDKPGANVV